MSDGIWKFGFAPEPAFPGATHYRRDAGFMCFRHSVLHACNNGCPLALPASAFRRAEKQSGGRPGQRL
jgi:hypothetical protein